MIICFSGTGNTRHVGDQLQDILGDDLVRFAPGLMNRPEIIKQTIHDGRIIWMFPVHSWGLPEALYHILPAMTIESRSKVVHHLVCTCGDDIGYADKKWKQAIAKHGGEIGCVFSVQMPNTYVALPGFDVDSKQLATEKLEKAKQRVDYIADCIAQDKRVVDVERGGWAWVKTAILHPLFRKFLIKPRKFHVNESCTGCGRCSRICPFTNIRMVDGTPHWDEKCTLCLRCYHGCPHHAVEYGKSTRGKGQYLCPGYTLKG